MAIETQISELSRKDRRMRVLVIFAHPLEDSYAAALRDVVVQTLSASGHKIDLCDLYKETFDPVMSAHERSVYRDTVYNSEAVGEYVQRLRQAEGVVFVFPTWWYGMPAILKGYLDRVWLPGVAFEFGPQAIRPLLTGMRLFGVITTTGAPQWFTRIYMGNPSRKVLMRGLARLLAARSAERFWLALYGMDNTTLATGNAFIEKVRARVARIRPNPRVRR
jgi:putative NADPH-quinone reductase